MRLQRIYSSKLYVTSTRKDRIHAAMQDPINAELVQQLSEYLDDEAQAELKQAEVEIKKEEAMENAEPNGAVIPGKDSGSSADGSFTRSSFSGSPAADFGEDEFSDMDMPESEASTETSDESPVEESTNIKGKSITATSIIWTTLDDVVSEADTIKGTLNAREDTNGVTRLQVSDHELWIYYDDESNLNDKMIEVISVLNSTGYTYLKFNRLARSNNAIVFDILLNANEDVKTVKEVEEEK